MEKKKFTIKAFDGKIYTIYAKDEGAAFCLLVKEYRINRIKSISAEEEHPEFIIQVGARDYTCVAPDARAALWVFAKMGLNMSKARNLRRC